MKIRTYMDVRFDVTDLTEDERGALAMEVAIQAEESGDSQDDNYRPSVDSPEIEWNEVEVEDDPPTYAWIGWEEGEELDPPEPGKMWLTITEDGEEMAVIVHRMANTLDPMYNDQRVLAKERRAQAIVDALNAASGQGAESAIPYEPKKPKRTYVLHVCLDGVPEGRGYDAFEETIDATGEAICRFEEDPAKIISLALSDQYQGYIAGPPKVLTAEQTMAILFRDFGEQGFDAHSASFISGADVCAALASHFNLSDAEINAMSKLRQAR